MMVSHIAHFSEWQSYPMTHSESESHCTFVKPQAQEICHMTNRGWVTFHILLNHSLIAASSPCPVCNQQKVSDILPFSECSLITFVIWLGCEKHCTFVWMTASWHLILGPTASEWHSIFAELESHDILLDDQQQVSQNVSDIALSFGRQPQKIILMTQRKWVRYCTVFDLIPSCSMTNREWAIHLPI